MELGALELLIFRNQSQEKPAKEMRKDCQDGQGNLQNYIFFNQANKLH